MNDNSNNENYDNIFGIGVDFSILDEIPDGLNQFKMNKPFMESFDKAFRASGHDTAVISQYFSQLSLFGDRWEFARYVRLKLEELNMQGAFDTQAEYLKACAECEKSTIEALSNDVVELKQRLRKCEEIIMVVFPRMLRERDERHEREMAEVKARLKEVEDQLAEALKESLARPQGLPQAGKEKKEKVVKMPTEKEIDEFLGSADIKLEEYDERTGKFKRMMLTMNTDRKAKGKEPIAEAEVLPFVNGLEVFTDTKALGPYVDRCMVESGWTDEVMAHSSVMCEVYSEFANILGKDNNKMIPKVIQNALTRYFDRKGRRAVS